MQATETTRWPSKHSLFGVTVSATDYEQAARAVMTAARRREGGVVTHMAVHALVTAARDPSYRMKVNTFEIVAPDGQPVRWALNRLEGTDLEDRVYGPELMLRLCRRATESGVGVYLYGSSREVAAALEANLVDRFPALRVVGCEPSLFRPLTPEEDEAFVRRVNDSGAGLLFLGLGCPLQETFAYEHRRRIKAVQLCVGAAFDFHAGNKRMAPGWMQRRGLEWLFRLTQEPGRLWRRYLVTNAAFCLLYSRGATWPARKWKHLTTEGFTMNKLLVTGSSGLIGSEVVAYFCEQGWEVYGLDNNQRADFFGPGGDTRWNQRRLEQNYKRFRHQELDVRDRDGVLRCVKELRPELIVHTAAQPSHDLAASRPFDDFDTNAVGTLNLLEATRRGSPAAVFVHMSTNKVYGDAPNELPLKELPTRWEYARPEDFDGIDESMRIDRSKHSLFGASKVAADVMVQEYGRYFGMKTCCLRGGCLTGPNHSGVELHGFLSYLVKCNVEGLTYRLFGYKGKQVRDNIHALDVARFIHAFYQSPRPGEVYNLGGGRGNSCSVVEAFGRAEALSGKRMRYEYVEKNREGDHICYVSNLAKARAHFPGWDVTKSLDDIFAELFANWRRRTRKTA